MKNLIAVLAFGILSCQANAAADYVLQMPGSFVPSECGQVQPNGRQLVHPLQTIAQTQGVQQIHMICLGSIKGEDKTAVQFINDNQSTQTFTVTTTENPDIAYLNGNSAVIFHLLGPNGQAATVRAVVAQNGQLVTAGAVVSGEKLIVPAFKQITLKNEF